MSRSTTAVCMLFMENQWDATKLSLHSVFSAELPHSTVSVLLNGSDNSGIISELEQHFPDVIPYFSKENIGVAGGRNFLMQTPEARNADYIAHLDNDIILTADYFSQMISFLENHPDAGVVGPVVFNADPIASLVFKEICSPRAGRLGRENYCRLVFDSARILEMWRSTNNPLLQRIGTNVNWRSSYCSAISTLVSVAGLPLLTRLGARYGKFVGNTENPALVERLRAGEAHILTANVAGLAAVYRNDLIQEIGGYDETFNPYWGEDIEFSIRAIRMGFTNYINTGAVAFHGTDMRDTQRHLYITRMKQMVRNNVLLRRRVFDSKSALIRSLISYFFCSLLYHFAVSVTNFDLTQFKDAFSGFVEGLRVGDPNIYRY